MRVLVTGGSGGLGRRVVRRLRGDGHDVVIATRTPRGDGERAFALGEPVRPDLLAGIDTVIHLASDAAHPDRDVRGAELLAAACREVGVRHLLFVSIVGIDDHPFPYYRAKKAAEQAIEHSGVPFTILRSTQFHDFVPRITDLLARAGVVAVPSGIRVAPIDPDAVAARVQALVEDGPQGRVPNMRGPEVLELTAMARAHLRATGRRTPVVAVPVGGAIVRAFRRGMHLGSDAMAVESPTYASFLADRPTGDSPLGGYRPMALALLAVVAWMALDPVGFHRDLAGFGVPSPHFVRDAATFAAPLGVALWMASTRPSWRRPVVALALLQNGLHLVNHMVDAGSTDPAWHGPANLGLLTVFQLGLVLLLRRADPAPATPAPHRREVTT